MGGSSYSGDVAGGSELTVDLQRRLRQELRRDKRGRGNLSVGLDG